MVIVKRFCGSSVGKKVIMAITGIGLVGFLLIHLFGNTAIYFGTHAFNNYAAHLHDFDPVLKVFEVALLILFLIHVSFGVMLFVRNYYARPSRYAVTKSSGGSTIGSSTMLYTGLIVFAFIVYHLFYVSFTPSPSQAIADVIRGQLFSIPVASFYIVATIALAVHLSHGLWSLWQSLGGNHPVYEVLLRRGAVCLAFIIGGVFVSFPILAMVWDGFLR